MDQRELRMVVCHTSVLGCDVCFAGTSCPTFNTPPTTIPTATDTSQEEGLHFQSVVFTSIDLVTAQLSPHSHSHTSSHLLHSHACDNDQFIHQQLWITQMRPGESKHDVTLQGHDIVVNEGSSGGPHVLLSCIQLHTSKCVVSSSRTPEVFSVIFKSCVLLHK